VVSEGTQARVKWPLTGAGFVAHPRHGALCVQHQVARLRQKVAPGGGQLNLAGGAIEQPHLQQQLELLDAARERGLRQVQLLRGFDKAAQLGHAHKGLQAVKVDFGGHRLPLRPAPR